MDIKEKLYQILSEVFTVESDEITPATTYKDLAADELDFVELAWIFEDEFDIGKIDPADLSCLETVGQMQMYILRKINTPGD